MSDWTADLPPLLRPEHDYLFLEATGDTAKPFLLDFRKRLLEARASAQAFAISKGGLGFWPPLGASNSLPVATMFAFDEKPTDPAWKVLPTRAADKHYKAIPAKKGAGPALLEEMKACTPFPSTDEIVRIMPVITDICYTYGETKGFSGVGYPWSNPDLFWVTDRVFVRINNPFKTIAETTKNHPEAAFTAHNWEGDPRSWRPPEGWTIHSKAEIDLIFAEAAVKEEREREVA